MVYIKVYRENRVSLLIYGGPWHQRREFVEFFTGYEIIYLTSPIAFSFVEEKFDFLMISHRFLRVVANS